MKEPNRARLSRLAARWERERAALDRADEQAERDAAFHAALARVVAGVLRPVVDEIRAELALAGHDCRLEESAPEGSPRIDVFFVIRGRSGSKDLVQFVVRRGDQRDLALIAELVLRSAPFELRRFHDPQELTADVAEQLLVDAVEQIIASPPR